MTTLPRPPRSPDFRYHHDVDRWTRELADYLDRSVTAITSAATEATNAQPLSPRLTAIAALSGTGVMEQTGSATYVNRAIGVTTSTSLLSRADGDGRYVRGPSSATNNSVARFNGTTGKLAQNSAVTIDDDGVLAGHRIGAWTANADAPVDGYVTVTDNSGATRKLATIA